MNLKEVYDKLLQGSISVQDASEFMQQPEIKQIINAYINKDAINDLISYNENDLQNITAIINITQYIYNNSGLPTGLSDNDYDILYSIMLNNTGLDIISSPILPSLNKMTQSHQYPSLRGTLSKVYYLSNDEEKTNKSRKYLDEWIASMERKYQEKTGKSINLNDEDIYVFPKFDGVSAIFELDKHNKISKVLTRGFTENNIAVDISKNFKNFKRKNHEFKNESYGLKTEVMMKESDLKKFNKKFNTSYKNTRSIVSGLLNDENYDPMKMAFLHIVPLRVGNKDGKQLLAEEVFNDYPYIKCKLRNREAIRTFAKDHKYVDGELRCDGAVIYIIDEDIQKILGRENDKNNFEVAYKFTEESAISILEDVSFNVGLFGRIAPVAKVKPVKLKGNTINNISLGSIGRLRGLNLYIGDKVKVLYDIIPYLTFDEECDHCGKKKIHIPKKCPICNGELKLSDSGDILSCINDECPSLIKGKILNYLYKMRISNLSEGVINKLYDEGIVKSIEDIYEIQNHIYEICEIDGFGPQMIENWVNSINNRRLVNDFELLGALGIESVSKKIFMNILKEYDIDELLDICKNDEIDKLIIIPGIKDKTAIKIIDGINKNRKLIKKLYKYIDLIYTKYDDANKISFCFTKIRDKDMEDYIEQHGGKIVDSVTKDTNYLVVPEINISSNKIDKAQKYGIPIIKLNDIKNVLH